MCRKHGLAVLTPWSLCYLFLLVLQRRLKQSVVGEYNRNLVHLADVGAVCLNADSEQLFAMYPVPAIGTIASSCFLRSIIYSSTLCGRRLGSYCTTFDFAAVQAAEQLILLSKMLHMLFG